VLDGLTLGAPGIYRRPETPVRALTGVRMDVCAFVGVAPRGRARVASDIPASESGRRRVRRSVPVAVESWTEYVQLFGRFEGPGLLPYAVSSFFEQGGRRAYVVRIVHAYGDERDRLGVASGTLPGLHWTNGADPVRLRACNEGAWGNRLRCELLLTARPIAPDALAADQLVIDEDLALPPGTLIRARASGVSPVFRTIAWTRRAWDRRSGDATKVALFDRALDAPFAPTATSAATLEVIEAAVVVDDGDGRQERFDRVSLSPSHNRWLGTVLAESTLVALDGADRDDDLVVDDAQQVGHSLFSTPFTGGADRYADITPTDVIDDRWTLGDEEPGDGVHAVVDLSDLSLLVVPDLYSPRPLAAFVAVPEPPPPCGPIFTMHPEREPNERPEAELPSPPPSLDGLRLDPRDPAERREIVARQRRLVDLAETLASFVILLDVPPGLSQPQILAWRAQFASAFAASYHPWLRVDSPDDQRDALERVPPSAVAAGIIAEREAVAGVQYGPANTIAAGVVDVDDSVSPARHDVLHQASINVFLRERDGVRLTGARTLSRETIYRQLSVRRLVTMLMRVLAEQMQFVAFEPNHAATRAAVRRMLRAYLRQLFAANAFSGEREDEAFFVQCDDALNPPAVVDAGMLLAHVGIAPAEALEFIVLAISRDGDGTLRVGETASGRDA
jgi:uncharacterized protein